MIYSAPYLIQILSNAQSFLGLDILIWQIILIPVLYGIVELIKYLYKTYKNSKIDSEKQELESKTNISKAVEQIINRAVETDSDKIREGLTIEHNKAIRVLLQNRLKIIQRRIGSDRVWVGKFHNGIDNATYPANIDQLFSIIAETLGHGISSQKRFLQNIPVAFYSAVLDKVLKDRYVMIKDISKIDKTMYLVLELQGIQSMGAVGIFNNRNELKGIIGVDFIRDVKDISQEDFEYLTEKAEFLIDSLTMYQLYRHKKP